MSRFVQTLTIICLCVASFSSQLLPAQQVEKLEGLAFDYDRTGSIFGFQYVGPGGKLADWLNASSLGDATITQITLEQHEILPGELAAIEKLGTLEVLVIGSYPDVVKIDDDAVEALGKIDSLQELAITAEPTATDKWEAIGALQSLRGLEIGIGIKLRQADLDSIGHLTSLEHLRFDGDINCQNFDWLSKLNRLRSLDISSQILDEGVLPAVSELHLLDSLSLHGLILKGNHVKGYLNGLARTLQRIDIELEDVAALESLKAFENLKHVSVKLPRTCEFDFSFAAKLPQVETMFLTGGRYDHADEERLSEMAKLQHAVVYDDNSNIVFRFRPDEK
jgi:hypothetical protein